MSNIALLASRLRQLFSVTEHVTVHLSQGIVGLQCFRAEQQRQAR